MPSVRICIDVDDLERGIAFYTRAFGLEVGRRLGDDGVELLGAPTPVDLLVRRAGTVASPNGSPLRDYARHWTPLHLDFEVERLEDAMKRALSAGATLEREIQVQAWGRMANMADPFGHGFCLLEFRGRGYDEIVPPAPDDDA
jgi:catechol 2,3-dioxygenase-like lactoylglutathione lyase family enzyme